jgi:hypothetical protein
MGKDVRIHLLGAVLSVLTPVSAWAQAVTVLYDDHTIKVERTLADPDDLWVRTVDLPRINRFELRREGACLGRDCIPVPQDRDNDLFVRRGGQRWISVTELARRLGQAFVADHDRGVWSFGEIPATRQRFTQSVMAPDFELPNREGKPVRLSDFRGKKVLIVTWASW